MPAAVSSSSPAPAANKATAPKTKASQQARKKRVVRRRRGVQNGIGSDDEIEREAASDSDFDEDDHSSLDSATDDSDTEPASEDSPSRFESPPAAAVVGVAGETELNGSIAPFFATSSTWSEMVADEASRGPSGLPVIDFEEFDGQAKVPARRAKKSQKKKQHQQRAFVEPPAREPQEWEPTQEAKVEAPVPRSASIPRKLGQTARQAYQQRLEADPSYVPKVGGFWGHDDRLMEKDLRSLSGWWRGKWSGRARGRGFGMRGGAHGVHEGHDVKTEDLPPVERQWTHDGFEEMNRRAGQRRQEAQGGRGRGGFRGGRGVGARGRGGFGRFGSPASSGRPITPQQDRVWFSQKPEVTWSKQSETFLFNEGGPKGRMNKGTIRVKLPGNEGPTEVKQSLEVKQSAPTTESSTLLSHKELQYTVKLPKVKHDTADATAGASIQPFPDPAPAPVETKSEPLPPAPVVSPPAQQSSVAEALPNPSIVSQLERLSLEVKPSDPERQAKTEEAVLRKAGSVTSTDSRPEIDSGDAGSSEQRPVLPPLQTVFTPPPPPVNQQSPVFGSPYSFPQALPPGIALNQHGMPYEVATGRPVYLQPPPPMYNPRPMHYPPPGMYMHGHPMHHPVASPDYLAQPPSHTPPMNGFVDPASGATIFSLPRSVRVEIRAPNEPRSPPQNAAKSPNLTRTSSKLRTGATSFEPSRPNGEYNPSESTPSDSSSHPPSYETTNGYENGPQQYPPMGNMVPYPAYQQPYFYPEPYGYPPYMDMAHGPYDMYNTEQPHQGTVYY